MNGRHDVRTNGRPDGLTDGGKTFISETEDTYKIRSDFFYLTSTQV